MFRFLIVTILILPALVFAKPKAPSNKFLKIGLTQEFENLNPLIMSMLATSYIYKFVGRNLVTLDKNGKWIPQLAKSIPTLKNGQAKIIKVGGKERVQATWEIKEKAYWGDGKPVTGEDVKFAWTVALSSNVSVPDKETYDQVEKIEVDKSNPKKFVMTFEKKKWDFYQLGTFYLVPKHLEEKIFQKTGKQKEGYAKNSNYTKNPTNPGLYNGPYKINELKLGSHISLVPNEKFYGKKPKIKKIVLKLIPNTGTLEANLRSGTIDMISLLGFSFDQALTFEKKVNKDKLPFQVNFKPGLIYEHIDLNLHNPILKNVKVRKALVHAIDRDELTKALFEGRQKKAIHNVAPIDPWFTDDPKKITHYKPSKRTARKLLDQAGWKVGKDGYRFKDGKALELQLMTTSGNKTRELVQVFLKEEWKKVGVRIRIKNEPPRVYFGQTVRKSKFDALAMYAFISSPENTPRSTFHSSSIPTEANGFSGQNRPKWVNKKVDKLLDAIDYEFDHSKRVEMIHQILGEYTDEVPVIPLYYRSDVSVTPKNLRGYSLTGHQFGPSNFVEEWELK